MVEGKGMTSPWLPSKAVIHLGQGHSSPKCLSVTMRMRNSAFPNMLVACSLKRSADLLL